MVSIVKDVGLGGFAKAPLLAMDTTLKEVVTHIPGVGADSPSKHHSPCKPVSQDGHHSPLKPAAHAGEHTERNSDRRHSYHSSDSHHEDDDHHARRHSEKSEEGGVLPNLPSKAGFIKAMLMNACKVIGFGFIYFTNPYRCNPMGSCDC